MITIKLKRGKVVDLFNVCVNATKLFGDHAGKMERKLAYACMRNVEHLKPEMEIYNKLLEPFEKDRTDFIKLHSKLGEDGEPVMQKVLDPETGRDTGQQSYDILPESLKIVQEKVAELQKEHKVDEFRLEEVEVTLHMISLEVVPDKVNMEVLSVLDPMIEVV